MVVVDVDDVVTVVDEVAVVVTVVTVLDVTVLVLDVVCVVTVVRPRVLQAIQHATGIGCPMRVVLYELQ